MSNYLQTVFLNACVVEFTPFEFHDGFCIFSAHVKRFDFQMYYDKWWKNHNHNLDDEERVTLAGCPRKSQTLDQVLPLANGAARGPLL
jgi:hypothetical protein